MTPHINAALEDVAETVIMPGDPIRAQKIAYKFLKNVKQINEVRNIWGFTGTYNDKKVTVFSSGMGSASIGIYAYELFSVYKVKNIIRVGTCGSLNVNFKIGDCIVTEKVGSNSNFALNFGILKDNFLSNENFVNKAIQISEQKKINLKKANVFSADAFYGSENDKLTKGYDVIEMETFALYAVATALNKSAFAMFKVSDSVINKDEKQLTPLEREELLFPIIEIALEII